MKLTVSKAIGQALHEEMERDENVILLGEDVGVMGNVFAITKGFRDEFGSNRVIDTPISESGFTGIAVGAAMRGLRPVVEWMYDDFITVCLDPVMNQAAKLRYMTATLLAGCGGTPAASTPAASGSSSSSAASSGTKFEKATWKFACSATENTCWADMAAKLAAELGVDLNSLNANGRVMKSDVLAAAGKTAAAPTAVPAAAAPVLGSNDEAPKKVNPLRRSIAANMANSWHTSPRVTYTHPVDATAMIGQRWAEFVPAINTAGGSMLASSGKTFKALNGWGNQFDYAAFAFGDNDISKTVCALATVALNSAKSYYEEKHGTYEMLQVDASLLYALPDHEGAITNDDKKVDSKYNLYKYKGLPPTPIANPGLTSLEAALEPESTDYYFYALGKDGTHHFSSTLKEHNDFINSDQYAGN